MTQARVFSRDETTAFREAIELLRTGEQVDLSIIVAAGKSISPVVEVELGQFQTRLEAARYLERQFSEQPLTLAPENAGLWTWLTCFYFDELVPRDATGRQRPLAAAHYVLDFVPGERSWQRRYRHLLATSYFLYRTHGAAAGLFLGLPVRGWGDLTEQIIGNQQFAASSGIAGLVDHLYATPSGGTKRGMLATDGRAGSLRRLIAVLNQLALTYDIFALPKEALLALLPREFATWMGDSG